MMTFRQALSSRHRMLSAPWRLLPSALIIGAQKAGTTSLYRYLAQHPRVVEPSKKEPRYFQEHYGKGLTWYRSHFPVARPGRLTLEASVGYLDCPPAPARVAAALPEVKLIALLRDPVERAWSHYHHSLRLGRETLSFEEAVASEEARMGDYYRRALDDPSYHDPNIGPYSYLSRGRYAEQVERWLAVFPRERLTVFQSEAFYADPEGTVQAALRFLGLPPLEGGVFERLNPGQNKTEGMRPETRAELEAYFAPHNERLYELLGVDFGWGSTKLAAQP